MSGSVDRVGYIIHTEIMMAYNAIYNKFVLNADFVTPLKKRRMARESVGSDSLSVPNTPILGPADRMLPQENNVSLLLCCLHVLGLEEWQTPLCQRHSSL